MNGRRIITWLLLAFVVFSIGFLVVKELRSVAAPAAPAAPAVVATVEPAKVVAYYFHTNKRCNTCRAIENQARDAIDAGFPEALMSGRLEWRAVNLDDPGNDHFYQDFQLTGGSLVLVDLVDGKAARFKTLGKTWDLVADPPAFRSYATAEINAWLEAPR